MRHDHYNYPQRPDRIGTVLALFVFVLGMAVIADRDARPSSEFVVTKTVPDGATIELRVRGQLAQSAPIEAGTYHITVRRVR